MPRKTVEQVIAASDRAWRMKRLWTGLIYECWWYAAPGMNPYLTGTDPEHGSVHGHQGQERHQHLYDSTICRSAERVPSRMVEDMFPPGRDWADLSAGAMMQADGDEGEKKVTENIKATQDKLYANLRATNVSLELLSMVTDAFVSGTGLMKVGKSRDSGEILHFEAVNQAHVALEAGPMGRVWGFHRKAEMSREHILATWEDAKEGEMPREEEGDSLGGKEPRQWKVRESTYYDRTTGFWYTDVIVLGDSDKTGKRIVERESPIPPWIAYRYRLLSGEVQGRSPVMAALPDARTLNHAKRVRLETASLRVAGIYTYVNDSTFNPRTVRLRSGSFWPVGSNARENPTIRPLEVSGDVQLGELIAEDAATALKETLLDMALPEPGGKVLSATEILERQAEARQQRGIPYLRMMYEVGRPLLQVATWILSEQGHLKELNLLNPPMKDGVPRPLRLDGTDVQLQFHSPHVQAQNLSDARTITEWAQAGQMAAGERGWEAGANVEAIPEELGKKMKVPGNLYRDEAEREERMLMMMEGQAGVEQQGGMPMEEMPA